MIDSASMDTQTRFREGFERLRRTWEGAADRVPITSQMNELALRCSGIPGPTFYRNGRALVDGIVQTTLDFQLDVPNISYDVYNIELEALGHPILFPEQAAPVADGGFCLLPEVRDPSTLPPPEPGRSCRMPFVLDVQHRFQELTGQAPTLQFCAPFSLAALVRGYERFIEDVCLRPEFAHELLTYLTERVIAPWINAQHERFPSAATAMGADAYCSPPMTSPGIIETFSLPYILRLRALCGLKVAVVNWWGESCFPDPEVLLGLKRRACAGLIRVQDPDLEKLGAGSIKAFTRRHGLVLELGVGEHLLIDGSREEIRDRIRCVIEQAAEGGRLILYLASLSAKTPPDNLSEAIETIHHYGMY